MDLKQDIIDNLKAEGLEIAEESAKAAFDAIVKSLESFVKETENPYDDLILPVLEFLKKKARPYLEDINKADNEEA